MLSRFPAGARQGDRLLVSYDGDDWWHERVVLGFCPPLEICIATAHWDLYQESINDYKEIFLLGPRGGLPVHLYSKRDRMVRFNPDTLERRLEGLIIKARAASKNMLDSVPPSGGAGKTGGEPPVLPPTGGGAKGAGAPPGTGGVWIAIEARHGVEKCAPIDEKVWKLHAFGNRGVATKIGQEEESIAVALVGTYESDTPGEKDDEADLRTLAIFYDQRGDRARDFSSSTQEFTETDFEAWPMAPRTCLWLLRAIKQQGYTPGARHVWWKQSLGLATSDPGVEEHVVLSDILETAVQFDALNVPELLCFEMVARRYQVWEQFYKEELRRANHSSSLQTALDAEERDLYMGQRFSRSSALACPALESHVADVLKDRAALSKEKRKARENLTADARTQSQQQPGASPKSQGKKGKGGESGRGG